MTTKPTVMQVEIFNQTYSVRAVGDSDYIRELAAHVDRKMREVAEHAPTVDAAKIAILAALNISDEYYQFRAKTREGDPARFAGRANRLAEKLDEILRAAPREAPPRTVDDSIGALRGA
jgi:cell division protein ZapA